MRLSRLEIYGFKSFAKKLDLRLTGGITSVVGPNGCGKTNVVDAIRWVLGEQKPSQIRLERMEDVLFKGSTTRRPLGMSEVSLTIENTAGILPVDMPEVTITRRLFRSGESEYMINRKTCRLADINDLFMDTGMGTDSYSVFELGMINAIISDKTDDRRNIFEEAAGVTKYKARRKSALTKLIGIESDLERVGDIIAELERRVESLKRQAMKARRYRTLKSELKTRTIAVASFEIARHAEKIRETGRELETLVTAVESLRVGISRTTAEIETFSADMVTVERELEDIARRFSESTVLIGEKEKTAARYDSRLESLGEIASRAKETSRRNTASLEKLAESHGECAGSLADVSHRLEQVMLTYDKAKTDYETMRASVANSANDHASSDRLFRTKEQELAGKKASLANMAIARESNERRLREISERIGELESTLAEVGREIDAYGERKLVKLKEERDVASRLTSMKESLDTALEEQAVIDARLRQALEKQASLKGERDILAEVLRSFAGYSEGVKNAVSAECLAGKVLGVLGDVVSTDETYLKAVEGALREYVQAVIVPTTEDAAAAVRFLSEGKHGRASFIPAGNIPGHDSAFKAPASPGVIASVIEVVRTEARFKALVERLFDGIVIVDSLETATRLHGDYGERFRYVTLNGEVVGTVGDIHGGAVDGDSVSSIGRTEKLETLSTALGKVSREAASLQEQRASHEEQTYVYRGLIAELENTLDRIRKENAEIASTEARSNAKREAMLETIANLKREADRIQATFPEGDAAKENVLDDIKEHEKRLETLRDTVSLAGRKLEAMRAELEYKRNALNSLEVERATLTEKKAALEREMKTIAERRESLAQTSGRTLEEINAAEEEILAVGEAKKNLLIELEELEKSHEILKHTKDVVEKRYAELRSQRSERERALQIQRRELDEQSRRESSLVLKRDEASMMMNNIRERLVEEYFIDQEEVPDAPDGKEFDPGEEKLLIEDLRRKIHQLGDVNLAAEDDYEEEKKRFDFLTSERNDLVEASDTLKKTIAKINAIARARFTETFELIRTNFQVMFNEFFEGGICDLALEEGIDPLEAGINITARPPGKNVRSINLLSSGERALTAISLLFAIYLVKPSPFCIMDEVDAPLDDANIDRYLKVIRRFSERTQFIMVTHNKKTMAAADNLYGITMEEPGLSTLVSVSLSESDTSAGTRKTEAAPVTT